MQNHLCVLLGSCNRRNYLEQAIRSILEQSNQGFDLLVSDNGSTDGSWELIQNTRWRMQGRVELIRNNQNIGTTASARRVSKLLKTPWVTILCDDDWLGKDFVGNLVPHLSDPPKGLVFVGHARTDAEGNILRICDRKTELIDSVRALREFEQKRIEVAGISGFAVPSRILLADSFPRNYPGGFCEDGMICLQAIAQGGAKCVSGVNYYRREWSGCESQRPDKLANQAIAYAMFARDIRAVLKDAGIRLSPRLRWEAQPLVSGLAFFARAVLLQNMPYSEFQRYYSFARQDGVRESIRAMLSSVFFALRFKPIVRCYKAFDDRRRRRLSGKD